MSDVTKLIYKLEAETDAVKAVAVMAEILAEPLKLGNRQRTLSGAATIAMNCPATKRRLHDDAAWQEAAVGAVFRRAKDDNRLLFALGHVMHYFGVPMNLDGPRLWPEDPVFATQFNEVHQPYKVVV
jgi:hypothetical protein